MCRVHSNNTSHSLEAAARLSSSRTEQRTGNGDSHLNGDGVFHLANKEELTIRHGNISVYLGDFW
ncbi:hypothetical protein EYF80_013493 [Liparis tanakae]|uniref:Uncharacterized protein n=1 Tax=Liparis tanakae TaxID=230148 RepID=A0A4Z2IF31_9TELE|nr:hypothetical protein EYF80_013493 [Liparis tanakae]